MLDKESCNHDKIIGYAYVPSQVADEKNLYNAQTGLDRGTIFPPLDLPLGVYGNQCVSKEESYHE